MGFDIQQLKLFLKKAKENTYASGNSPQKRKDGASLFKFSNPEFNGFEYEDTYFGSKKFAGQEVVKFNGTIIWSMVYYGGIIKDVLDADTVYNRFLIKFLSVVDKIPARGINSQISKNGNDKVVYSNILRTQSDITHFKGREFITYNQEVIYELFYSGGIIN